MKTILLAVLLMVFSLSLYAQPVPGSTSMPPIQEEFVENDYVGQASPHHLGGMFSMFTNPGLIYMYFPNRGFGYRISTYAYGDNSNTQKGIDVDAAIGGELLLNLVTSKSIRFYMLTGIGYAYSENSTSVTQWDPNFNKYYNYNYQINRNITGGLGFGIELYAWRHVSFSLEGGYRFRRGFHSYSSDVNSNYYSEHKSLLIGLGTGVGAYWVF
jgi:hypothetical protein